MRVDRELFRRAASDIAREVHGQARYARDGGIYWMQPAFRQGRPAPPRPLDSYLYPGTTGVALFFALAARVIGIPEYGPLALDAIAPLRRDLRAIVRDPERARGIERPLGGLAGLGSLVYGLVRLGDLLAEPALWDEAAEISAWITPERIFAGRDYEVMTGSAGALLALLALDARRPEANRAGRKPLDLALTLAEHILSDRDSWIGRIFTSTSAELDAPSIGFCHGAAGITCALARLARRTGREDVRTAAQQGWEYVETAYQPRVENWRLSPAGQVAGTSWCNGATGIVLAGLEELSPGLETPGRSLAGALRTLQTSPLDEKDHLCCGNMGRVDGLLHASHRLKNPAIRSAAESLAMRVLERAQLEGRYRLMFYPEDLVDVRLFPGSTGVGLAFLRLVAPETLPCLLALA